MTARTWLECVGSAIFGCILALLMLPVLVIGWIGLAFTPRPRPRD